jgi:predicted dehydrogenase
MKKIGCGVIGPGSIAEIAHLPSINANPKSELIAVCSPSLEEAKAAAKKWGAKRWYDDYEKMVKDEEVDAVIIASPDRYHCPQTIAAAEAGKHVICEKPLACTNKEAWMMVDVCKKAGTMLMTACNHRFWLQHEIGKQLVDEGVIGEIKSGKTGMHEHWQLYQKNIAKTKFRLNPQETGGPLFDQGSHRIDLLRWLFGREVKRVVGTMKKTIQWDYPYSDVIWILIEFENGSVGCYSSDRFSHVAHDATILFGTEGMMGMCSEGTNPFQSAPLAIFTNKDYDWESLPDVIKKYRYPLHFWPEDIFTKPVSKRWVSIYPPREWSYTRMLDHFFNCIIKGEKPRVTGEDGAKVVEILCATIKSMETGGWVKLPLKEEIVPPGYEPIIK